MWSFQTIAAGLRSLFQREEVRRELDEELGEFVEMAAQEKMKQGMSRKEALRQVRLERGSLEVTKEVVFAAGWESVVQALWQDSRFGLRMLRKNPGFTAVAVLTLALGIGATTAIFSVVYGVLLRPLPYHNPQQIVRLWEENASGGRMNFADPNFDDLRAQNRSLSSLASFNAYDTTVIGHGDAVRTPTVSVSRDFFEVMAIQPVLGRTFSSEDQRLNAPVAALVSYSYWTQALGGIRDLSSVHLKMDNQSLSIIGVLPTGFHFPDNADIWIPREISRENPSRSAHNDRLIGRLRDGYRIKEARADLTTIAQRLKLQYGPDTAMVAVAIEPLHRALTNDVRPALIILLAASGFLLLIACANVTNLMLAQAAARGRELAIRAALGAPRVRLVRQFLTEAFLLSFIGGAFGVALAYCGLSGLLALAPTTLPRLETISINLSVLSFSFLAVLLVAVALALFTALHRTSRDSLNGGSRGGIGTRNKHRIGRLLAAAQLATALILLVGSTLLGRSLLRVLSVNPGFRTENVLTMQLGFPFDAPKAERIAFVSRLVSRLRQIPGVDEVGGTSNLPLSSSGFADGYFAQMNPSQISPHVQDLIDRSANENLAKMDPALQSQFISFFDDLFRDKSDLGEADFVVACAGYFRTLNIPLLQGRLFDERDTIDAPHVALISQALARARWPDQNPIGRAIEFGNMDGDLRLLTVVGVVGDVRDHSLESAPPSTVYVDYHQRPTGTWNFTVVLRSAANPETVLAAARGVLHDLDPAVPPRFSTLSSVYSATLDSRRFSLTLIGIFSVTALVLGMAGIYGVISYSVAQRTREIGVRMALGASTTEILAMVLKEGILTGVFGLSAGLLGSFAITRWLQSQLFEVSPTDPLTLAAVSLLLVIASMAACWIPARRATRIDPVIALRCE